MHLGNGAITTECMVLGYGLAAVGLGSTLWMPRRERAASPSEIAALGTFVFAAQMVNLPVGSHSSAHLVGGVLLAHLLGPSVGMRLMALILALQTFMLGDGGISSLGINTFNMAIVPALLVTFLEHRKLQSIVINGFTGGLAVLLAALLIPAEVAIGRSFAELQGWQGFFQALLGYHIAAAILEGVFTVGLILVWQNLTSLRETRWAPAVAGASGLLLMAFSALISSEIPDGYEAAAQANMQQLLKEEA